MQEGEPASDVNGDVDSRCPGNRLHPSCGNKNAESQRRGLRGRSGEETGRVNTLEEVVLQAASGHVLVDQKLLIGFRAVSDELHQIFMVELAQVSHLRLLTEKKKGPGSGKGEEN